jgi:hypothetical protein
MKQTIEINDNIQVQIDDESLKVKAYAPGCDPCWRIIEMDIEQANMLREWLDKNLPRC